jgi:hypothetical protein
MGLDLCLQPRLDRRSRDHGGPGLVNIYDNTRFSKKALRKIRRGGTLDSGHP